MNPAREPLEAPDHAESHEGVVILVQFAGIALSIAAFALSALAILSR